MGLGQIFFDVGPGTYLDDSIVFLGFGVHSLRFGPRGGVLVTTAGCQFVWILLLACLFLVWGGSICMHPEVHS